MTSQKQIDANRINAQKSTGPTTAEGKIRSSLNGFKSHYTGLTTIMADEDSAARAAFVNEYSAELAPVGAVERELATGIALDWWRLRRIKTVEENIFAYGLGLPAKVFPHERIEIENAVGHAYTYVQHAAKINSISLYESRLTKIIHANEDRLKDLQSARLANPQPAKPEPISPAEPKAEPKPAQHFTAQNGLAPANSQTPPQPAAPIATETGLQGAPEAKAA
jgi:hypothetical protein